MLFLLSGFASFAQIITLTGVVSDKKTNTTLPGATVKSGDRGTSTNAAGEFVLLVDKDMAGKQGLSISFIGYQKLHMPFNGVNYRIKLTPANNQLNEIVISGASETILQKAIRKIPENYADKDFMLQGMARIIHNSKDSATNYNYYNSDGLVKMYYPTYADKNRKPEIMLLNNKDTLVTSHTNNSDMIRWLNSYTVIPYRDVVHSRLDILKEGKASDYTYTLNGKEWLNGSRVYVVNFFAKGKKRDAGTIYIDTVNYAFVRIEVTKYNVTHAFFIPTDKSSWTVNYKKQNNRWYLNTVNTRSIARHDNIDLYWSIDYKTTLIDTVNVQPLHYQNVIPGMTEDVKVKKSATGTDADHLSNLFALTATDSSFNKVSIPAIDTTANKNAFKTAYKAYQNYVLNNNIRFLLQVSKLPVSAAGYQPGLSKTISSASDYTLGFNSQYRLYKQLFFQWDEQLNFGIGGINNREEAFYLTYNFEFNKNNHPITLSPITGYSTIALLQGKTTLFNQRSWASGLNLTYDLQHRVSVFIAAKYYSPLSTTTSSLLQVNSQNFSVGAGLILKLTF